MNCEELKSHVLDWFGQEIECHSGDTDSLIATIPLLKPDGDPIEVCLQQIGSSRWKVSDLGNTHSTFFLAGLDLLEESVRGAEFHQVLSDYQIKDEEKELSIETSADSLIETVFDFVHAIQSVLALQLTAKPKPMARDFPSIVAKFLAEQKASFEIPSEWIDGKAGRWQFHFVLNHVKKETLVKALTVPSHGVAMKSAEQAVFEILDVRSLRGQDTNAVVIADDEGPRKKYWQPSVLRVFQEYRVPMLQFETSRQELIDLARAYVR